MIVKTIVKKRINAPRLLRIIIITGFYIIFSLFTGDLITDADASATMTLSWNKVTDSDLAGYRIYYDRDQSGPPYNGTGAINGPSPIEVPVSELSDTDNPAYKISGLSSGVMYYFTVTAYDTAGNESGYSNEAPEDTDGDGLPDYWEMANFGNLGQTADSDYDNDEITNLHEYNFTNPNDSDTDKDGIPDGWEVNYGLDPLIYDGGDDPDNDGFTNLEEYLYGYDPNDYTIPSGKGWPVTTDGDIFSSPVIGDIDGDLDFEVVAAGNSGQNNSKVYAWHSNGTPVSGWPIIISGRISSSPALADMDGDKDAEVIIGSEDDGVYAWHHDGTPVTGWPVLTVGAVSSSPAAGDIDGDGEIEIIAGTEEGIKGAKIYAWHRDGTPVDGWPIDVSGSVYSSPALGDIDNDGYPEIIAGLDDGNVYAWNYNGTIVNGWPVSTGGAVMSSPALGDIDNDGDLEIVMGSDDSGIYAWHHDGTLVSGWPVYTYGKVTSSPALGDINNDGRVDIVIACEKDPNSGDVAVYALNHDGSHISEWPVILNGFGFSSSPILADIDGDKDIEIIVGGEDSNVYAWHHNAELLAGWPIATGDKVRSSPTVADIDRDGDTEIIVGSDDNNLYVWDLKARYDSRNVKWAMFGLNARHTGYYKRDSEEEWEKKAVGSRYIANKTGGHLFVEDASSGLFGLDVVIPSGALLSDTGITISEVINPPSFDPGISSVGVPADLGPDGLLFYSTITIGFPYTWPMLNEAGVPDPEDLTVHYYNDYDMRWEEIPIKKIDKTNEIIYIDVNHFTIFSLSYAGGSSANTTDGVSTFGLSTDESSGKDDGGCFISTSDDG